MDYKEQEFKRLKDNIENEGGSFNLTEMEIDNLIDTVRRIDEYNANIGAFSERCEFNEREKAFKEQWQKINKPVRWINNGNGTLQDLFVNDKGFMKKEYLHIVTEKERFIVATAIQWLGTNCGMCFLEETLAKFGKKIVDERN